MTLLPARPMQRSLLLAAALLSAAALLTPLPAQSSCKPNCATGSVVNAAGMPPKVASLVSQLGFEGNALSAKARTTVRELAAELKASPLKEPLKIMIPLEDGASGKAALQQAQARAKNLRTALAQQGLKAGAVEVVAGK